MKNPMILFLLAAILLTAGTSCNRRGCTHPAALNYNPDANKEDGSCIFEPMPIDPILTTGSLYVHFSGVNKPTELKVNGQDITSRLFTKSSSVEICNNPTYATNVTTLTPGLTYTIYAKNDLYEWNITNVSVIGGDCKIIELSAANSTTSGKSMAVFTSNTESGMRNITVSVDGDSVGTLAEWSSGAAIKLSKELKPGKHGYTALSQNGQMWADSFTVVNGQTVQIALTKATAQSVQAGFSNIVFYSSTYKNISVFVDNVYAGRTVGTYPATSANLCTAANAVSVIKKADSSYSYTATSTDGQIWSGTVSANFGSGCILVELN